MVNIRKITSPLVPLSFFARFLTQFRHIYIVAPFCLPISQKLFYQQILIYLQWWRTSYEKGVPKNCWVICVNESHHSTITLLLHLFIYSHPYVYDQDAMREEEKTTRMTHIKQRASFSDSNAKWQHIILGIWTKGI